MTKIIRAAGLTAVGWAMTGLAWADVPSVATDITPVHGLVARVMQGVGQPDLVVPPGASPHSHSMRPSEAKALNRADVVFWIGPELTPWLEGPISTLASKAVVVPLLTTEGTQTLVIRDAVQFTLSGDAHHDDDHHDDHGHDSHGHDEGGHDEHHDDHADHHDEDHDTHDDHGHAHEAGSLDPHAWLMAENGLAWLDVIADVLAEKDPENAGMYRDNAKAGQAEIIAAAAQIKSDLESVRDKPFVVFHDAYQYFEIGFGLPAAGAISLSDASDPSPSRIAEIRDVVTDQHVTCVLSEPQFNPGLVATVLDGTDAGTAVVDPLGVALEPGPGFYTDLLASIANAIADCK
ncbi:zinc ABC transporter substrate-binding protein [Phaeobacter italicus]|uniref:zinc ABC transporter substrate-binding protein n=1 Tax=Phaeobacter italicus TaxID=481446 RepID=UPI001C967CBE|nr:zinc ABC transporter substrate-binding protein [Phaeobacter italicus]MBY5978142.1 zinc ABC transporter substrate-binding protein [Phaeobacter italicus]